MYLIFCHFHMLEIRGSHYPIYSKLCTLVVLLFCIDWQNLKKFGPVEPEIWPVEY